jgi:hypothetical protein
METADLKDELHTWHFPGDFIYALLRPGARLLLSCPADLPLFSKIQTKLVAEKGKTERLGRRNRPRDCRSI